MSGEWGSVLAPVHLLTAGKVQAMITDGAIQILFETSKLALQLVARSVLEGFVKDVRGQPLEYHLVQLRGNRATPYEDITASTGRFIINGIKPGQYDISISSAGRGAWTYDRFDKVLLKGGIYKSVELILPKNADFSAHHRPYRQMDDSFVGINVVSDGRLLGKEGHVGTQFIKGKPGTNYSVLVHNYTTERVLSVITVDGLSIIDGKPGSFLSGGYIVDPGRVVEIKGWRIDEETVAKFVFSSANQAYATVMTTGTDLGVIGCAFFYEKRLPEPERDPGIMFSRVGTGFGSAETQRTKTVTFDRETDPFYLTKLLYLHDTDTKLSAGDDKKNPFPGCRVPPGWSG